MNELFQTWLKDHPHTQTQIDELRECFEAGFHCGQDHAREVLIATLTNLQNP